VVSLDATPKQYDALGDHYDHGTGPAPVERLKTLINRRCFERAAHIVTWAEWTKQSLISDYAVDADKITVIPPGVETGRWLRSPDAGHDDGAVVRILFVGGDLRRKGGDHLMEAFRTLRYERGAGVELHVVTTSAVEPVDGMTVHRMAPNSPELIELYHRSHIFCLPTLGDCLPMVLPEAGAAALALVATDVGAIGEIVRHGETGLLVGVGDVAGLTSALRRLVEEPALRAELARAATRLVCSEHDALKNARRLVATIRSATTRP
jgi:glycosyltransferase involved in cell wall biosynthesis